MRRSLLILFFAAVFFGAGAGLLHLYIRFSNNSQGEMFNGSGHVDIAYSALMFLVAFVPIFGVVLAAGVVLLLFQFFWRRLL